MPASHYLAAPWSLTPPSLPSSLDILLAEFPTHTLDQGAGLSLMNRVDTKYLVPLAQLDAVLAVLRRDYSVLGIDGRRIMHYSTDYLDTARFDFYNDHHNGRSSRSKVRCRRYVDSGQAFLEIKGKNNKGFTLKSRVPLRDDAEPACQALELLRVRGTPGWHGAPLHCSVRVDYHRIALQSVEHGERASIDLGLCAQRSDGSAAFALHGLAIVELKQSRFNPRSPLGAILRRLHIGPVSFSKYCVACALLFAPCLRTNRFKPLLTRLAPHLDVGIPAFTGPTRPQGAATILPFPA